MKNVNWPVVILLGLVTIGLMYSIYASSFAAKASLDVKNSQIIFCELGLARSIVVVDLINQAAQNKRNDAFIANDPKIAVNDIHIAESYETLAQKYYDLTPKNCDKK